MSITIAQSECAVKTFGAQQDIVPECPLGEGGDPIQSTGRYRTRVKRYFLGSAMKRNPMGARCQPAKGAAQTPVRLSDGGGDAKLQISTYRFADAHAPAQRGNHDLDARLI